MFTRQLRKKGMVKTLMVLLGITALFFLVGPRIGATQEYPTRPVTVYVGYPPGAAAGVGAQLLMEVAKKYFSQPILINYKPGASSLIAADFVLKQPADGYTLFWANPDLMLKFAKEGSQIRFTKEDFIPIGTYVESPFLMTVSKEKSPFMKFEDLIDYARKNPGKVSYPSSGLGTTPHLINEVLQEQLGIKLNHIPFAGGTQSLAAMLGGHVDYHIGVRVTFGDHVKPGGSARVLAVTSRERWPEFPDVPTLIEKGCNLEYTFWCFLWAAKGTPQPVLDILGKVLKKAADDPQFEELCRKAYYRSLNMGPEETRKKIDKEIEFFSGVCRRLDLK